MWVLVDIGCIECGAETTIAGVYKTEEEAKSHEKEYFNGEEHRVIAFELPKIIKK